MNGRPAPSTLREMTRAAVRARISDAALDLFVEHGFDDVTVEQIASTVGISTRSFNRYFPTKEDAVLGDTEAWGILVRDTFAARPGDESVWHSLQQAYAALLALSDTSGERRKRGMRVLSSAPSLRARNLEKHLLWAQMLTPLVAERLDGNDTRLRAYAIVQASIACFEAALNTWAEPDENRTPTELLAIAFDSFPGWRD
ncbi:TetR family transcriptional regulator [Rhodococcus sp. NPDC003318]|uniref:TetR family transcriptional regulator n=1 Tax=Rhodococcus sp. NPDC003318 TaxID=3364503 RepID=UPI0036825BDA